MKKAHDVSRVWFDGDTVCIRVDGKDYAFDVGRVSKRLQEASSRERAEYEISPSGYGIHWLLIDEDLSIDGLLGIEHEAPPLRSSALE